MLAYIRASVQRTTALFVLLRVYSMGFCLPFRALALREVHLLLILLVVQHMDVYVSSVYMLRVF